MDLLVQLRGNRTHDAAKDGRYNATSGGRKCAAIAAVAQRVVGGVATVTPTEERRPSGDRLRSAQDRLRSSTDDV